MTSSQLITCSNICQTKPSTIASGNWMCSAHTLSRTVDENSWKSRASSWLRYVKFLPTRSCNIFLSFSLFSWSILLPWNCILTQSLFISMKLDSRKSMEWLIFPKSQASSEAFSGRSPRETCHRSELVFEVHHFPSACLTQVRSQKESTCWVLNALAEFHKIFENDSRICLLGFDVLGSNSAHQVPTILLHCTVLQNTDYK